MTAFTFLLILVFADGSPPTAPIQLYDTPQACVDAGDLWLVPASNPTGTVKDYICAVKKPKS